jgi:hypothetical protein
MRKIVIRRLQTRMPASNLENREIVEDIDYYTRMAEKISPYPYMFTTKAKVDSISAVIKAHRSLTPTSFYEQFLTLQAAYNVAHMYSHIPQKQYDQYANNSGIFPVKITLGNDTVVALASQGIDESIKQGEKILKINGWDADSLFRGFYRYVGGLTEQKRSEVSRNCAFYLWLNNIHGPYHIESLNGSIKSTYTLRGYKPDRHPTKTENHVKTQGIDQFISYQVVNDSIAYIDFKGMSSTEHAKFNDFFATTFDDIRKRKINILFIDLRRNNGGNSSHGSKLIRYFAPKPFRMSASKQWLVSQEYKDNFLKMVPWYARIVAARMSGRKEYFKHPNGVFFEYKNETTLTEPREDLNRFTGQVYVIIGNRTFSSAIMTANAIQDYDLATLVGEPTGDAPNQLGEIVAIRLPNSKITCWLPSALFVRANGDHQDINPVIPDIKIKNIDNLPLSDIIRNVTARDRNN